MLNRSKKGGPTHLHLLKPYNSYLIATVIVAKILFCVCLAHARQQDGYRISGTVLSAATGVALDGATVKIKGRDAGILTNVKGQFSLNLSDTSGVLTVSYIGFETQEIPFNKRTNAPLTIRLESNGTQLEEVQVSTGYQTLPKERATGSFEVIGKELLNRSLGPDVLSRLDGITAAIRFDKRVSHLKPADQITIRGLSTIRGDFRPLIILDNFPYDGDPANINPNDVESVTILKDAAAASIWGTKAANGVIVITTKTGKYNQTTQLSINSNLRVSAKPDLFYLPEMSSSQFIELETFLFNKGYYNRMINNPRTTISPVVELLDKLRNGTVDDATVTNEILKFRQMDVRNDYLKYVYRPQFNQQYSLNLSGGTTQLAYMLSAGYDNNLNSLKTSGYDRYTVRSAITAQPLKNLEIKTTVNLANGTDHNIGSYSPIGYGTLYSGGGRKHYPYLQLADDYGNPLAVNTVTYRVSHVDTLAGGRLLDWQYRPLAEMDQSSNKITTQDLLLNVGARYTLLEGLSVEGLYQHQKTNTTTADWEGLGSYYTRNLINLYTTWNESELQRNIPVGDIMSRAYGEQLSRTWRGQLNVDKSWKDERHRLNAIAGAERREVVNELSGARLFGYSRDNLNYQMVNYQTVYPLMNGLAGSNVIPNGILEEKYVNRYVSVFANAAYSYLQKYTISASARRDASNIFGVKSNRKWQPLWSTGISWLLSGEDFYRFDAIPYLKFRLTYGINGKVNSTVAAFATIDHSGTNYITGLPYATMINPPNPSFRWEKVAVLNAAIDFSTRNNRINGSVEFFKKNATDIISEVPIDPTTGFDFLSTNTAHFKGRGVDVQINTENIKTAGFRWQTAWLFNYNRNIVTKYLYEPSSAIAYTYNPVTPNPVEGRDLYGLYAFRSAGLDPQNGDPIGYLNGEESKDYLNILYGSADGLKYFGPSVPVYAGAVRNTFTYKGISLSANITYKLLSYFKRDGMDYYAFGSFWMGHKDFAQRWQRPGDEAHTHVPSMSYPINSFREEFYRLSDALIERGDHIRLRDINISYTPNIRTGYFKMLRFYANVDNLGIFIWRKNKLGIDPEVISNLPMPRIYSLGFSANF